MTSEPPLSLKKLRLLSQALFVSGVINIGVLGFLSYWIVWESPPTPYCELKPATYEQQQVPLADYRNCGEVINGLQTLSFDQLIAKLDHSQLIENGYAVRDLALSCLAAFHHFDLARALPDAGPKQQRILMAKNIYTGEPISLAIYPGLTDQQFHSAIEFAKKERWPLNPQGLFILLQKQKVNLNIDLSLSEAFMLTPEFMTVELLFKRTEVPIRKQKLLEIILEGDWPLLKQFVEQQRQVNDVSPAKRQKFLLDYVKIGSEAAAYLLIDIDEEFAIKKLDDAQVIALLQLLPVKTIKSEHFALALLTSPRSTSVWQQASLRLYEYAGEPIPEDWNYQTSLKRFIPHHLSQPAKSSISQIEDAVSIKEIKEIPSPPVSKPLPKVKPETINAKKKEGNPQKPAPQCRLYIVQEGDSLWKISRRFSVDMEVLKERNQLQSNAIKPGTVLKIP